MAEQEKKTRRARVEPRKRPQQKRSAIMVERILSSALQIVQAEGVEGASTISIAEHAGLSVGSIYQYFPNKDAIVLELARRWLSEFPEGISTAQNDPSPMSWEEFAQQIHAFVQRLGGLYKAHSALIPIVNSMYTKAGLEEIVRTHDAQIVSMHAQWLKAINPALDDASADRLGLLMLDMGHACLSAAVRSSKSQFEPMLKDIETMHLELLRPYLASRLA